MQVVVDDKLVNYSQQGKGQVILFVHGWLDSEKTFLPLIKQLSSDYRCVALDLPNFGASQQSDGVVTIEDYAKFIAAFIKKLKINNYVLVGHSLGGQIAIYGTGEKILKPDKLILIAAAGLRNKQLITKQLLKYVAKLLKPFVPKRAKDKLYKRLGSDYQTSLSPIHKKIIASVLKDDIQSQASKIRTKTLLIYGDQDKHTPVWMGQKLSELIPNSKLAIIKGYNHWLHQQAASQVADKIKEFLK